jgi:hypothetical protein
MKHLYTLALVMIVGMHLSCKRDFEEDFRGPELAIAGKDFHFVSDFQADKSPVNFEIDRVIFQSVFSAKVTWTLKLYGTQSGATKSFTGISSSMDNTNAEWDGSSENIAFFQEGENCIAELSIFGRQEKWYDTVAIVKPRIPEGILVSDFDGKGKIINSYDWWDFFDEYTFGSRDEEIESGYFSSSAPIQKKYYHLKGDDKLGPNNYYIGGIGHNSVGAFGIPYNTSDTYFNLMYRGSTTASAFVSLTESDGDKYEYKINGVSTGWQILSVKLTDFTFSDTSGGGTIEASKITKVDFLVLCEPLTIAEFDVDYIIFTESKPFHP